MDGLVGTSIEYFEALYRRYEADPMSVEISWRCAFDMAQILAGRDGQKSSNERDRPVSIIAEIIRQRGHLDAKLDPLALRNSGVAALAANLSTSSIADDMSRQLVDQYCGSFTVETAHIDSGEIRAWVQQVFEEQRRPLPAEEKIQAYRKLVQVDEFERFLGKKYPTKKRFGAEGAEAMFPMVDRIFREAAKCGVDEIVVGPMHRGRTSLMGILFGTPLPELFAKFKGAHPFSADAYCAGDVPYHLGAETEILVDGHKIQITLCPNPSHLEAVNPMVAGRVRARQDLRDRTSASQVLGLLFHSDAAVVGQGIVSETLQLSGIPGFATHGTIHLVVNNQVGFTTDPWEARTSWHCTGPFKAIDAPIIHVNGDDIEACIRAADLAVAFRKKFERDIVIDLVCYRRSGHNELDEPRFTQPVAYAAIDGHQSVREIFEAHLKSIGLMSVASAVALVDEYRDELQRAYDSAVSWRPNRSGYPGGRWEPYRPTQKVAKEPDTGIDQGRLATLLTALSTLPSDISVHPKVRRLVEQRSEAKDRGVPWSLGEALAFSSLVTEGTPVRLTGEDSVRGTFSTRHFGIVDLESGRRISMLDGLFRDQAAFTVLNSPLSEYAVLGFEYGYSLERPDALTVWEAQFGDFVNGAQIMVDQFIASGEEKWLQPSGLVLLVPHGLEGQGPEHSSARPERYLQLAAKDNIQIANPSTPANYFHLLRRQMLRTVRKPLVILAPKTLLRLPAAVSPIEKFQTGNRFEPVLSLGTHNARQILICSGKIAYELMQERTKLAADDVDIVRLELLYPFPATELSEILARSPGARVTVIQEEPQNMGIWPWIRPRIEDLATKLNLESPRPEYVGRPESPSPAGGFHGDHERDQAAIVKAAFAERPIHAKGAPAVARKIRK